jgi:hypothetical protein
MWIGYKAILSFYKRHDSILSNFVAYFSKKQKIN